MGFHLTTGNAQVVFYLIVVLAVLSLILIAAVILFKMTRDRLERNSAALQARIQTVWESGDAAQLRTVAEEIDRGGVHQQSDLTLVCNRTAGASWWTPERESEVQQSFIDAGLAARLQRQLTGRNTLRRGLSVYLAGFPCWHVDPAAIESFTLDEEPTIRMAAVGALERIATPPAADALITALEQQHLARTRIIERLGHDWAVPSMLTAMDKPGQTWEIRSDLLRAMAMAADARSIERALLSATSDYKFERMQAMRVLAATYAKANDEQKWRISMVAVKTAHDEFANVRSNAIEVLRQIPEPIEFDMLEGLVGDPDWFVRRGAARALVSLGEEGRRRLTRLAAGIDPFAAQRAREELAMHAAFPDYQQAGA